MSNIFDYIHWRGDLDFEREPFNPVDGIVFSQLSYLPFDGIVTGPYSSTEFSIRIVASMFNEKLIHSRSSLEHDILFKEDPALLDAMAASERYGSCRLCAFVNNHDINREVQFSAVSVLAGEKSPVIVYRGTDLSLVGWKEDFNMSFSETIPAQLEAVKYLEKIAQRLKGPLRICGHSKGGNLAIFAASHCSKHIRKRITDIYSYDAPGFHEKVITSEGFVEIRDRIHSYVPQASVVGMLLEHNTDYKVVKSEQTGLLQHEMYSWDVIHNDMVRLDSVTLGSRFVDKTLREWLDSLNKEQREKFFETLYAILSATEAKSLTDLESSWFMAAGRMIKSLRNVDDSTRTFIRKALADLLRSARQNIHTLLPDNKKRINGH